MDDEYEIVYGKKYKKCKDNQIRNPITHRCIDKDKKTAKEIFKRLEKLKVPNSRLKIVKKRVPKKKILSSSSSPKTSRKDVIEKILSSSSSSPIISRKDVYKKINKFFKIENLIRKNKLNENYYLSYLEDKKGYLFETKTVVNNELIIFKKVSKAVLADRCPHFPILFKNVDLLILTELTDGNLGDFLKDMRLNKEEIYLNALSQIYLSLMFFYKETNNFITLPKYKNFVYKKVEKGGYYHYNIYGFSFYLENLGYLWMIRDYETSISFEKSIDKQMIINNDFVKITEGFLPYYLKGWIKNNNFHMSNDGLKKIHSLYSFNKKFNEYYTNKGMNNYLKNLMKKMLDIGLILKSISSKSLIINSIPYEIK
jgi:hypothetical protein